MLKAQSAAANKKAGGGPTTATSTSHDNTPSSSTPSTTPLTRISLHDLCGLQKGSKDSFLNNSPDVVSLRSSPSLIVDVWADNLREVCATILEIVDEYPYIAMDTEFPGIVARPLTTTSTGKYAHTAHHYSTIKLNVEMLKLIQLGLCFCNAEGEVARGLPSSSSTLTTPSNPVPSSAGGGGGGIVYQFHFKFSLDSDLFATDSIEMLMAAGIDFNRHQAQGIEVQEFSEFLMTSGVILNEEVRWLTFHSGFDFAYLLHLLIGGGAPDSPTSPSLPATESEFFDLLSLYFPCLYDLKALLKSVPESAYAKRPDLGDLSRGGLQRVAEQLGIGRIGRQHQAGSDALLTAAVFFRVRELFFKELTPPSLAEIQRTATQASAAILNATSPTSAQETAANQKEKEVRERDREREAYTAASDATASLLFNYQQEEEKFLNVVYGLQPMANQLLRAQRERERAQIALGGSEDDTVSVSSMATTVQTSNSSKENSRASSRLESSPTAFKPATGGNVPDF